MRKIRREIEVVELLDESGNVIDTALPPVTIQRFVKSGAKTFREVKQVREMNAEEFLRNSVVVGGDE